MINMVRKSLGFYTRFETGESFFRQYARSTIDMQSPGGITAAHTIALSETHKKLIVVAQQQNILHKDIGHVRALHLSPMVHYYDVGLKTINGLVTSRGTSLTLDEAVARAFGEMYERVAMRYPLEDDSIFSKSVRQLMSSNVPFMNLAAMPQPTQLQKDTYPDMRWDQDSQFGWTTAKNIFSGAQTAVPAQLVYFGYTKNQHEPILCEKNTHGLGAGYTYEQALESAAAEVIQRHSFFSFWYAHVAPPRIQYRSVLASTRASLSCRKILAATLEYGFTMYLLDCTLEKGIPSVCTILTKPGLGWFVGMSTSPRYDSAIERSISEALSVYTWAMQRPFDEKGYTIFAPYTMRGLFCDNGITDIVRVHSWTQEETARHGAFFLQGQERTFDSLTKKDMSVFLSLEKLTGGTAYVKAASQTYLTQIGFHSVRIIAPSLYRLSLFERLSVPVLNKQPPANTYPHPFP